MIPVLSQIWAMISGCKFFWKVISNWVVLKDSFVAIENTLKNMQADGRMVPNQDETPILLMSISNILKTEIIDIPGVDEFKIAASIDQLNANFSISIQDAKSGKYFSIPIVKKSEDAIALAKEESKK